METKIIEVKLSREDKFSKDLEDMRVRDSEAYNKLKMNLEHNIQVMDCVCQPLSVFFFFF